MNNKKNLDSFNKFNYGSQASNAPAKSQNTVVPSQQTTSGEQTLDIIDDIINEVAAARQTERGTRADDKRSETAMEDRKIHGYF